MIMVSWRSTIYNQILIADATGQIVYATAKELEEGPHTVSWYALDMSNNKQSNPTRVSFTVSSEAFVSGQQSSGTSPWVLIGAGLLVFSGFAVGHYFRRKKL